MQNIYSKILTIKISKSSYLLYFWKLLKYLGNKVISDSFEEI